MTTKYKRPHLDKLLMTSVLSLRYDNKQHIGYLFQSGGCCCDMTAAIKLFEPIDPDVGRIETYAGSVPHTLYVRTDIYDTINTIEKKWEAYRAMRREQECV